MSRQVLRSVQLFLSVFQACVALSRQFIVGEARTDEAWAATWLSHALILVALRLIVNRNIHHAFQAVFGLDRMPALGRMVDHAFATNMLASVLDR